MWTFFGADVPISTTYNVKPFVMLDFSICQPLQLLQSPGTFGLTFAVAAWLRLSSSFGSPWPCRCSVRPFQHANVAAALQGNGGQPVDTKLLTAIDTFVSVGKKWQLYCGFKQCLYPKQLSSSGLVLVSARTKYRLKVLLFIILTLILIGTAVCIGIASAGLHTLEEGKFLSHCASSQLSFCKNQQFAIHFSDVF